MPDHKDAALMPLVRPAPQTFENRCTELGLSRSGARVLWTWLCDQRFGQPTSGGFREGIDAAAERVRAFSGGGRYCGDREALLIEHLASEVEAVKPPAPAAPQGDQNALVEALTSIVGMITNAPDTPNDPSSLPQMIRHVAESALTSHAAAREAK